jgi:hypothetical protein
MSVPNPSDDRPSEIPSSAPIDPRADAPDAAAGSESDSATGSAPRPSFEEQLTQTPYSSSRGFTPPDITDSPTVVPPPPLSTPIPPSPYAQANPTPAAGLETPTFPQSQPIPPPPPSPYAPSAPAPSPYSPAAPPVYTQEPYSSYQPYAQSQSASSNAIASLVCGILSWTMCGPLTGLPAAIIGFGEVKRIERGEASPAGKALAQWGAWLGLINCIGAAILVAIYALILALAIGVSSTS